MSFRDDVLAVLTGGLPALGTAGGIGGAPLPRQPVEEIPPEPQLQDREPFLGFGGITQTDAIRAGAAILGLLALFFVARRI